MYYYPSILGVFNFRGYRRLTETVRTYFQQHKEEDSPEGLVDGPVPAEEGARSEEDEPQDGEAEIYTVGGISGEVRQTGQHVEEQGHTVD